MTTKLSAAHSSCINILEGQKAQNTAQSSSKSSLKSVSPLQVSVAGCNSKIQHASADQEVRPPGHCGSVVVNQPQQYLPNCGRSGVLARAFFACCRARVSRASSNSQTSGNAAEVRQLQQRPAHRRVRRRAQRLPQNDDVVTRIPATARHTV